MTPPPAWNFEQEPPDAPDDETAVNLRAYFDRMPDVKMREYRRDWSDARVVQWDENFRDDDTLFLICSEREVGVEEYRQVLERCIRYRERVRGSMESAGT